MNSTQYSELDRIKLKIKALAAKTTSNGATEQEALAAMNVVGRLLTQYNLTMNELDVRDATYRTIHMEFDGKNRHPIDHCIPRIATLVGCKTWFQKRWGRKATSSYAFFGQDQDLQMAEFLYRVIMAALEGDAEAFKLTDEYRYDLQGESRTAGEKRSAYHSFQRGMANRLCQRLHAMKLQKDMALHAKSTSTALVVLKDQLVTDAFKKEGIKLRSARTSYRIGDQEAYAAGRKAGDNVNLSRPIEQDAPIKGLLK